MLGIALTNRGVSFPLKLNFTQFNGSNRYQPSLSGSLLTFHRPEEEIVVESSYVNLFFLYNIYPSLNSSGNRFNTFIR